MNQEGVDFYNRLIDACLEYGITPMVTIFHWDLPQYLEEKGGWLNRDTCVAYTHYAKVCFERFGDRESCGQPLMNQDIIPTAVI